MRLTSNSQRGMSLVEVLAALTVFSIVTIGVVPLLSSALRGSNLSRASTVGRDVALEGMERVRGLPYFISYQAQAKKVDVLDMYFPCANTDETVSSCAGDGTRTYDSGTGVFSVQCAAGVVGSSCAVPLPAGYSLVYEARFVAVDGTTTVIPPSSYKRDPAATETQLDAPPSQLMRLKVTALWTLAGSTKSYTLESIVGDRKFGTTGMSGLARINYGIQAQTAYVHDVGDTRTSDLRAVAGSAESRVEARLVSAASQQVRAADVTLIRRGDDIDPVAAPIATALTGVAGNFAAPPTQTPTLPNAPTAATTMTHPNVNDPNQLARLEIARLHPTSASGLSVSTSNQLPSAAGSFRFEPDTGTGGFLWLQNQADTTEGAQLKLDPTQPGIFSLRQVTTTAGTQTLSGATSAATGALGSNRRVQATATLDFKLLRLMPTTFLRTSLVPVIDPTEAFVVMVKDFTATVDCKSVGSTATAVPTPTWSATFEFWADADNDADDEDAGLATGDAIVEPKRYTVSIDQSVAASTPQMKALLLNAGFDGGNPLVYDGTGTAADPDLYLFEDGSAKGYLTGFALKPPTASKDPAGTLVTAGIDGAIRISTVPTKPGLPESGLTVLAGSLTCEALDTR